MNPTIAERREAVRAAIDQAVKFRMLGAVIGRESLTVLLAHMDEQDRRIAELSETWMDDNGTTWTRPTAWAYAQACRVINERRDNHGLVHLEEVERLRTALRECRNQLHGLYGNHPMVQRADAALATPEVDHA